MYLTIGETKLLVGQFDDLGKAETLHKGKTHKLELNFEYLFDSYSSYRRFVQVIADTEGNIIKIKIKSEFKKSSDCIKLSRLLIGVEKLLTPENLQLINQILESSHGTPQDFLQQQTDLIIYFS